MWLKKKYENGEVSSEYERVNDHVVLDVKYKDGKPYNGFSDQSFSFGPRGSLLEIKYRVKDGKYQGEYKNTRDDLGTTANYEDGVLHGTYYEKSEEMLKKGIYHHGKFTGTVERDNGCIIEYHRDGELECTEFYKRDSEWRSRKYFIAQMRENGECKEIDENGNIVCYQQKNGVKDGTYEVLASDGSWVRESGTYKNGKLNGVYREFNSDGTLAARHFYKDGEDITPQQEVLRSAAAKNVNKENTEGKVNPKQSKVKKAQVALEMKMAKVKDKLMR